MWKAVDRSSQQSIDTFAYKKYIFRKLFLRKQNDNSLAINIIKFLPIFNEVNIFVAIFRMLDCNHASLVCALLINVHKFIVNNNNNNIFNLVREY